QHCSECAEHDSLLRSKDVHSLSLTDVGNAGWDPICFISPAGFAYYLPALARLALAPGQEPFGWYGCQLAFHLCQDGPRNGRVIHSPLDQGRAVTALLAHIIETRAEAAEQSSCADRLLQAHSIWSDPIDCRPPSRLLP